MQIENHKEEVPFSHYEALFRKLDPQDALTRLKSVQFDGKQFTLTLLGRPYAIAWPQYAITPLDGGAAPNLPTQTFLLRCLLEARELPGSGEWKTSGDALGRAVHSALYRSPAQPGRLLLCTKLAQFRQACEKLGAQALPHGDAGYEFPFFGPYSMRILIWEGDDEFPPSAQLLYTDNFAQGFAAEDRVVAGDILIGQIKAAM